jgi:hypothetical protein
MVLAMLLELLAGVSRQPRSAVRRLPRFIAEAGRA